LLSTPVVLIVFRRPDVTRRNIDALRKVQPTELFVIADGPRPGRPEEAAQCEAVHEVLREVDWDCTIHTKYAERNLGLEANVELGLDWVFSQVDRAIVLEDDCIADPSFFAYCEELLTRYEAEKKVWLIAGDNKLVPRRMFQGRSYDFASWASVWGWATWADRWHAHRELFNRDHAGAEERVNEIPRTADAVRDVPALPRRDALVTDKAFEHFSNVAVDTDGDSRGWDHHYWVTIMSEGGLCATPAYNTIENDGYGEGATHTRSAKAPTPAEPMPFPLVHPPAVELNTDVQAELELVLLRIDGRLSRVVRKVIRPLWMRAIVRKVITQPLIWRFVRKILAR
jgi:hypothetical protein